MSILIGILVGIGICWYAHRKLGENGEARPEPVEKPPKSATAKSRSANTENPAVAAGSPMVSEKTATPKSDTARSCDADYPDHSEMDDLKKIGGIGPKIAAILNNDGVISFRQLSEKKPSEIKSILDCAGARYRFSDLSTWSEQAGYAAKGDWKGAKAVWARSR